MRWHNGTQTRRQGTPFLTRKRNESDGGGGGGGGGGEWGGGGEGGVKGVKGCVVEVGGGGGTKLSPRSPRTNVRAAVIVSFMLPPDSVVTHSVESNHPCSLFLRVSDLQRSGSKKHTVMTSESKVAMVVTVLLKKKEAKTKLKKKKKENNNYYASTFSSLFPPN